MLRREVKGNYADRSTYGGIDPESDGVLVCTIEKANQTITGLLEEENMGRLSCIVVDELHMVQHASPNPLMHFLVQINRNFSPGLLGFMHPTVYASKPCRCQQVDIERANCMCEPRQASCPMCVTRHCMAQVGDQDRGYLLELMLTKLRYATAAVTENHGRGIQIVGMSATLSNAQDLAQWLSAQLYQTSFRPVKLRKYVKVMHVEAVGTSAGAMNCNAYEVFYS